MKKLSISLIILCITSLSFAQTNDASIDVKRKGRPDVPGTFLIELGWNLLQDAPSSMDMNLIGSRTLNMIYFYDIQIGSSKFSILPGIGVGLDRYKFDNDVRLQESFDADGNKSVSVVDITSLDLKKSMLVTNYLDIPLEFRFHTNPGDKKRSFKVGVGAKAGMRFSSHMKLKYEQEGENVKTKDKRSFELNRFRYGLTGRVGVGGFNVFYYQSLSTLFDGNGPVDTEDTSNITIGLSFTGF